MRPSYQIPNRNKKFSKVLVPTEYERMKTELEAVIKKEDFVGLSSDGWKDVAQNKLVNFIVHAPKPFLFETIDTEGKSQTAIYISGLTE
jgi:hypothetical protein